VNTAPVTEAANGRQAAPYPSGNVTSTDLGSMRRPVPNALRTLSLADQINATSLARSVGGSPATIASSTLVK
jgi:hypothetical protein